MNKWEWGRLCEAESIDHRTQNKAFHSLNIQTQIIKLWVIGSAFVQDLEAGQPEFMKQDTHGSLHDRFPFILPTQLP